MNASRELRLAKTRRELQWERREKFYNIVFSMGTRKHSLVVCDGFVFIFNHRWTQMHTDKELMKKICVYPCLSVV